MSTITKRLSVDQVRPDGRARHLAGDESIRAHQWADRGEGHERTGAPSHGRRGRLSGCYFLAGTRSRKRLFASPTGAASRSRMSPSFGARSMITPSTIPGPLTSPWSWRSHVPRRPRIES